MLATRIGSGKYNNCLFNAAGPRCTTAEELDALRGKMGDDVIGGVVSKSMTLQRREGNSGVRYADTEWGSINSMGLPNEGFEFYREYYNKVGGCDGKMIMSISGMSVEENLSMLDKISDMGRELGRVVTVELNLSCPNIVGKSQLGYDFEAVKNFLWKIRRSRFYFIDLGLKLPPYFDMAHFKEMGDILRANKDLVRFVVCVNSIGNGLVVDFEKESVVIEPKEGFGGIGGDYILPTALANVRKFYQIVGDCVDIVGVGGVKSGREAFLHILCGASGVQIGTALMKEGVGVFDRVSEELIGIMKERGYEKLEDFKGKLRVLG